MTDTNAQTAAAAAAVLRKVKQAGGVLNVMTGAGMSVMSGVPVFRNADGTMSAEFLKFLGDYNAARRAAGLDEAPDWFDFSVPHMFDKATEREAWAYWRWRTLRAMVAPAEDYRLLNTLIEYFGRDRAFVTTSNCDMLHVLSGTSEQNIHEIHGSLGRTQCSASCCETMYPVDAAFLTRLRDEPDWVPRCPVCNTACLRPNVMIFGDHQFVTAELDAQARRSKEFDERGGGGVSMFPEPSNQVVLEIGGGVVVPSIRMMAEYSGTLGHGLIRINPSEAECAKTQCQHTAKWLNEEYFPLVAKSDAGLRALCRELGLGPES